MIHQISAAQSQGYTWWHLKTVETYHPTFIMLPFWDPPNMFHGSLQYSHVGGTFLRSSSIPFTETSVEQSFRAATLLTNAWLWKHLADIVTIPCLVCRGSPDISQVEVWKTGEKLKMLGNCCYMTLRDSKINSLLFCSPKEWNMNNQKQRTKSKIKTGPIGAKWVHQYQAISEGERHQIQNFTISYSQSSVSLVSSTSW